MSLEDFNFEPRVGYRVHDVHIGRVKVQIHPADGSNVRTTPDLSRALKFYRG
jgi:hypothetical protein